MRRRKHKIKLYPKYILLAACILCLAFIFISYRYTDLLLPVKTAVGDAVTPLQRGINKIGRFFSDQLEMIAEINSLQEQNAALQAELDETKVQLSYSMQYKAELDRLRKLYELDTQYEEYPKVGAHVISKDSNSYYSIFTVDKGSEDGITVDMNVIAGDGLVGIVTQVGKNYAVIRSIIDDSSYVSGMFSNTSDTCDVKGDLMLLKDGYIHIEAIALNADVHNYYKVVTSHISDKFLPGILIGYAVDIRLDASNMTKCAYLEPAVDFEHLSEVLIIKQLKVQLIDEETEEP